MEVVPSLQLLEEGVVGLPCRPNEMLSAVGPLLQVVWEQLVFCWCHEDSF